MTGHVEHIAMFAEDIASRRPRSRAEMHRREKIVVEKAVLTGDEAGRYARQTACAGVEEASSAGRPAISAMRRLFIIYRDVVVDTCDFHSRLRRDRGGYEI